jgi:hypothetical protein
MERTIATKIADEILAGLFDDSEDSEDLVLIVVLMMPTIGHGGQAT